MKIICKEIDIDITAEVETLANKIFLNGNRKLDKLTKIRKGTSRRYGG
ncbi:MAG: hypothetical protein ACYDIA_24470 [Candidatus Humimicrobiaceae bacterium]